MSDELASPAWFAEACGRQPEEHRVDVAGCAIRLLRWRGGSAAPIVLVHGAGANAAWWVALAPLLAEDRTVVVLELSGHGDSGWRGAYTLEQWAQELLSAAAWGVETAGGVEMPADALPILVGHSLGGQVCITAAAQQPARVGAVVLCDVGVPFGTIRRRRAFPNRFVYASRQAAIARFKLIPHQPCANAWLLDHIAQASVRPVTAATHGRDGWSWKFDFAVFARTSERPLPDYLAELGCPVGFLNGAASAVVTREGADRTQSGVRRPLEPVWLEGARHHLMLDAPLEFVAALSTLLGRLAERRSPG